MRKRERDIVIRINSPEKKNPFAFLSWFVFLFETHNLTNDMRTNFFEKLYLNNTLFLIGHIQQPNALLLEGRQEVKGACGGPRGQKLNPETHGKIWKLEMNP